MSLQNGVGNQVELSGVGYSPLTDSVLRLKTHNTVYMCTKLMVSYNGRNLIAGLL